MNELEFNEEMQNLTDEMIIKKIQSAKKRMGVMVAVFFLVMLFTSDLTSINDSAVRLAIICGLIFHNAFFFLLMIKTKAEQDYFVKLLLKRKK